MGLRHVRMCFSLLGIEFRQSIQWLIILVIIAHWTYRDAYKTCNEHNTTSGKSRFSGIPGFFCPLRCLSAMAIPSSKWNALWLRHNPVQVRSSGGFATSLLLNLQGVPVCLSLFVWRLIPPSTNIANVAGAIFTWTASTLALFIVIWISPLLLRLVITL